MTKLTKLAATFFCAFSIGFVNANDEAETSNPSLIENALFELLSSPCKPWPQCGDTQDHSYQQELEESLAESDEESDSLKED